MCGRVVWKFSLTGIRPRGSVSMPILSSCSWSALDCLADGVEQGVAGDPLAALHLGPDQAVFLHPHPGHVFPEAEDRVAAAHVVPERLDDLPVHEVQHGGAPFDDGHADAQGGEHGGILEADDPGAYHDHALGDLLTVAASEIFRHHDLASVVRDFRIPRRARAAGDEDVLAPDLFAALGLERVGVHEGTGPSRSPGSPRYA